MEALPVAYTPSSPSQRPHNRPNPQTLPSFSPYLLTTPKSVPVTSPQTLSGGSHSLEPLETL